MKKRLIDEIDAESINNAHLKELIGYLKKGLINDIDPLTLTPETAQISNGSWNHHKDHTDYTEKSHKDSSPHSDYCD